MTQTERRLYLIRALLEEEPRYREMNIPEDEGWHRAAARYAQFVRTHREKRILLLELGVGYNTPSIIKYPFWQIAAGNPDAVYACVNLGEAMCPKEIAGQSICIDGDIHEVLKALKG